MLHAPSFSGVTCKVRVGKHPRLHKNLYSSSPKDSDMLEKRL